jgi:RND family efflux transporter MFP subunit
MSGRNRFSAWFGGLSPLLKALVILGVGVFGFALLMVLRPRPAQQEPPRRLPLVVTIPADVRSGNLTIRGNGTVRPRSEITLSPQVAGRVEWVAPSLASGGHFQQGQVLLRIESDDYENAVESAAAEVAQRQVDVLEAEERRELALEEYDRLRQREGIETPPDSGELGSLIFREPQLRAAEASLRRAEARLEDARLSLDRTRIRAPFDGVVRSKSVDVGQYVAPGQVMAALYDSNEVEIVVPLTDSEASLVEGLWETAAGDRESAIPATVRAEFGGRTYTWGGYVDRAEAALNPETRTVDVVVRIPDPFLSDDSGRPPLLLGTYADVDIQGAAVGRYLVVPQAAFRDGREVWVVREDTLLVIAPAALIQEVDGEVFVEAGVRQGEPVVVSPIDVVTNGMTVRIVEGGGP